MRGSTALSQHLGESLKTTTKNTTEHLQQLHARLHIDSAQKNIIASTVTSLQKVFDEQATPRRLRPRPDGGRRFDASLGGSGQEGAHGILVDGGSNITISGITVSGVWGDCIKIATWATGVTFRDSTCLSSGRSGVSVTAARNVTIQRVAIRQERLLRVQRGAEQLE